VSVPPLIEHYLHRGQMRVEEHQHRPVYRARDLAAVECLAPATVAKTVFFVCGRQMMLAVVPADRDLNLGHIRLLTGCRDARLATEREIRQRIETLAPGAVPPFGSLFGMPVFMDDGLLDNDLFEVAGGDPARSLTIRMVDFLRQETPLILPLACAPAPERTRRRAGRRSGAGMRVTEGAHAFVQA